MGHRFVMSKPISGGGAHQNGDSCLDNGGNAANDWATSIIDLKDAYFHVPVAKSSQKYL